jgi:hypothetical protein
MEVVRVKRLLFINWLESMKKNYMDNVYKIGRNTSFLKSIRWFHEMFRYKKLRLIEPLTSTLPEIDIISDYNRQSEKVDITGLDF